MTKKEKAIKTIMNSRIESNKMDLKPTFLLKQKQNELSFREKMQNPILKMLNNSIGKKVMPMGKCLDELTALYKQEIKGILNLDIFANKYSSRFVNKGILMAYDAIKEHIEGKKEEPKGEQNK